jgi:hypothetical protein
MRYHFRVAREALQTFTPNDAGTRALLRSLKARAGATVVGLIDGATGRLHASSEEASPWAFWNVFYDLRCMTAGWGDWDLELLGSGYARRDCLCGAHRVEAFTVHDRWILVVLATDSLAAGAQGHIERVMETLGELYPGPSTGRAPPGAAGRGPGGGGGNQGPAELGLSVPRWTGDEKPN